MVRLLPALCTLFFLGLSPLSPAFAEEEKAGMGPWFVRFEPLLIPLLDETRVAGMMSITVTLQVPSAVDKDQIEAKRPKFIDAFNARLIRLGQLELDARRPLNIKLLATELQTAADKAYGKRGTRALIVSATAQRL